MGILDKNKYKVIRKGYHYYANHEYQRLWKGPVLLISQKGNIRLIEQRFEYLTKDEGYMPSPEEAIKRRLQVRSWFFGMWVTKKSYGYNVDVHESIREMCFGTQYDDSKIWKKEGLLIIN